ncbi:MAG TPA: TonB-dependent receptor [Bacteroidales bacterium]|nr:TonB-dependent receptor [Bacteroidales bacterium]HPT11224.1 TonB-dependent receptor [Bacteroidales bacterium]
MKKNAHFKGFRQKKMPLPKKLILHLFLAFCLLINIQAANAQDAAIRLKFKDAPLKEVLTAIEKQSSYTFVYNSKIIDVTKPVTIDIVESNIKTVMERLLKDTSIAYNILEKQIVLSEKTAEEQKPPVKIIGVVKDEDKMPMTGVSIGAPGTSAGTYSDQNGNYTLEVPANATKLIFSYIGYNQQEVFIEGRTTIDIQMQQKVQNLEEVVVVGYGSIRKKDLTGSIVSVRTDNLNSLPVPSIGDALQGRASGVQVISSGVPGSDPTFLIRGVSSINSSSPLFVIDGVPVTSGLNTLNPRDIESLQILKDASSAAIYGSRGANGVIIVTTKRGNTEKSKLNLDYYYSVQQPVNMIKMLNASEYAAYNNEMLSNAGEATNPEWAEPSTLGKGTDWLGELINPAPMQNISLSYSSNTGKLNTYTSVNYLNQEGIIINTGYKRLTVQFNSDNKVFDFLKFGNNITLNHDIKRSGDYSLKNTMGSLPTQTIYNEDGSFTNQNSLYPQWYGGIDNPIGKATLNKNQTKGYNLIGSIFGELDVLRDFHFRTSFGLQLNLWDDRNWDPAHAWPAAPQTLASLYQRYNKTTTWLWDNTLTYNKVFNNKHSVSVMAGTSAQESTNEWIAGGRKGFISEETQVLDAGSATGATSNGGKEDWALFSYFGRVNYSYEDKYLVTATVRRDGSSRFGPGNRFGTFPSASVAWRISKENFFSPLTFINDLKLRAGYGETGNQEIGSNYPYASSLAISNTSFNNTSVQMVYPLAMPNYGIHWETVKQTNIGFDASVLDNRIKLSVDGFVKNTTGMLVRGVVIITTGYDNKDDVNRPYVNAGKMQNKGFEVAVESQNLKGDLTWTTSLNLTYVENKIIDLCDTVPLTTGSIDGNINQSAALHMNGHPGNAFFGYVTNGIFQTAAEVNNASLQNAGATQAGDIRFKDLNNDGVINEKDRTFIGNPNPKFILSLNNTFTYKGFDLNIFFQGAFGGDIFNANRLQTEGMDAARNQSKEVLKRWTGEGTSNSMPRAVFGDPAQNNRISDRYVENGSYLRLKTLSLGYTLPEKYAGKIKASNLRVYATAQNLFTITSYSGIDPEVGIDGIDNNLYPLTRVFSIGANMSF